MGSVCELPSGLPTDVLWGLRLSMVGPLKDSQRLVPNPLQLLVSSHCCGEPSFQCQVKCTAEQVFFKNFSVCGCMHPSLSSDQPPVPATENHPHSMMLPTPCFTIGMVSSVKWWAVPPDIELRVQRVRFLSHQYRPSFPSCSQSPLKWLLSNSKWALICPLLKVTSVLPLYHKGLIDWVLLR